ncbi:LysR family transcriptional regulator [Agrobacterium sp. SHOUNA12C]|uniref:HTH-type transcriptional regulator TtuA n=2 Tax=Rhizobium rhizogenes TaxID=359 RepID=B9J927_RHIR8|nr:MULTISPECIES: LysR family transcriptional regulator [Rhizobium]ACM25429.1 transcriptional regulator protein [Rhizobium rhizogenes K84]KAA6486839.1 LysR family transcriptional regulator [Agrobacterium sp. ICMP 7243]MCJ9722450.1 LysR family transcriptional regulator [Agrobacterium sp. BETTINA12B]MCJ9757517.1 LysR family transcriptional regulator [Agrobacterium sp. SHOUNA12C]OCI98047.1 LysR family transcriptional regulator [Agrobacterium sp. 13-626]OCJ21772.1 LysR family transcriptional regul
MKSAPHFTWDDLQFFLAVARTGQLSTAARQLRSSHATVSRRIDRLEFALKVKLFERNPRGYVLTGMGQRFIDTAERMEQETERLRADLTVGSAAQRGVVRISAPEGISNFFFTTMLPEFTARYPNISLELVTIQQIMSLSRKEADIVVVLDPPKAGPYFTEKLTDYHLQVYGSRDYLANHPPVESRNDLPDHAFVGYIEDMIFAPGLDYLGDIHPRIKPQFQSSSIFAQLTATKNGLGLCVLPYFIACRHPDLQMVLPDDVDLKRHYWITCHRDLRQSPRVRTVIDFLMEAVHRNAPAFLGHGSA